MGKAAGIGISQRRCSPSTWSSIHDRASALCCHGITFIHCKFATKPAQH
jgi:hypothetical protein